MEFQEKYFEKNGIKMKYFVGGAGKLLIFLHGSGVRALAYKSCLDLLAQKYQVVAPDLPCFGDSTVPPNVWNFSDFAHFINEFIKLTDIENPILIGHSFGGGVALNLAQINHNIAKLILVDSAGIACQKSMIELLFDFFVKKTINDLRTLQIKRTLLLTKYFLINVINKFLDLPRIFKINLHSISISFKGWEDISVSTMILWGKNDEIFSAEIAKTFNAQIKNSTLKIIDGNHDWILFYPQILIDSIKN